MRSVFVLINHMSSVTSVMTFYIEMPERSLSPLGAVDHNFTKVIDGGPWLREPSPENIAPEIAETATAWIDKPAAWRIIEAREIPADPPRPPLRSALAEIDALNARIDAMTAVKTTTTTSVPKG